MKGLLLRIMVVPRINKIYSKAPDYQKENVGLSILQRFVYYTFPNIGQSCIFTDNLSTGLVFVKNPAKSLVAYPNRSTIARLSKTTKKSLISNLVRCDSILCL